MPSVKFCIYYVRADGSRELSFYSNSNLKDLVEFIATAKQATIRYRMYYRDPEEIRYIKTGEWVATVY